MTPYVKDKPAIVVIIPARMDSSRFPGKPLELLKGRPMLWHIWKRCALSTSLDTLVVATCDEEIRRTAEGFGARVVMTSRSHVRANDRVAEAAAKVGGDIVVNVQGDEPLVHPQLIDDIVAAFSDRPDIACVNPVAPITDFEDLESPNTVKVVFDEAKRVLYFSRYPIPCDAMRPRTAPVFRQVPILGFRYEFLVRLAQLPETPLEMQESVDLLRAVEHGLPVHVLHTEFQTIGVDVPSDIGRVEQALESDPVYGRYAD
jgi:3-deoxy-manno-octulosonate cytidylyltransferase (CMP-KDO synthetase)